MYIFVDEIKKHLNIDPEFYDDDEYLSHLEDVAEVVVSRHIGRDLKELEDENHDIPAPIKHAMLLLIGNFYSNRESVSYAATTEVPHSYEYLLDLYVNYQPYC